MNDNSTTPITYSTIEEIRLRKAIILKDIQKDDNKLHKQWTSLFAKPVALSKNTSPSKRIGSLMSAGVGIFDMALLGWKLYRKFKK